MPSGWHELIIALVFVVPGFVMLSTLQALLPRRRVTGTELIVNCLTASAFNFALWFWLIYWIAASELTVARPFVTGILLTVVTLLSPMLTGLLIARFSQERIPYRILSMLGFRPLHPTPTAWDFRFHQMTDPSRIPSWVMVTLKQNKAVCGKWGYRSFASSDPDNQDIYLESVWRIEDNGDWTEVPQSDGILVPGDQIAHIEFWNNDGEESKDAQND